MDINNKVLWIFDIFGVEVWITQTIFNTWITILLLIVLAVLIRVTMGGWKRVPSGLQGVAELLVEKFDNIVRNAAGEKFMSLGNWFFAAFAFILASNIVGIFGLRPPTADWATTFAFAAATFIMIQGMGIKHRKGKYLKSFFKPNVIFFPLNLIGELARPVSLSFRLFGNVLAGMILTSLIYSAPYYLRVLLPAAMHAYFDLFSGVIQTYIFCVLSLTFIGGAAEET
ncbi:MAG: F0F1 ATP synthase subunit A [Oscillospiraceae bacterium]|nr:F0F1 ATP synthase subunit A [Oscillospiraceae bacterium]